MPSVDGEVAPRGERGLGESADEAEVVVGTREVISAVALVTPAPFRVLTRGKEEELCTSASER
jgi:hypothetical protein